MAIIRPASNPGSSRTETVAAAGALRAGGSPGDARSMDRRDDPAGAPRLGGGDGCSPRRQDWCGERPHDAPAAQRKWMREHPYWPSSSCVAAHFGAWSNALKAAGLPARSLTFEDTVAERIETAWRLRGEGHRIRAIAGSSASRFRPCTTTSARAPARQCGGPVAQSPRTALPCAAPRPSRRSSEPWTRETVRDAIRDWTVERGHAPSYHEWTPSRSFPGVWEAESPRWPSAAVVCDVYGDYRNPWNAAILDAGASIRFQRWSDDAIRAALADFWTRTGRAPVSARICWTSRTGAGPTSRTMQRRYGGIERAWATLGPVPASYLGRVPDWRARGPVRSCARSSSTSISAIANARVHAAALGGEHTEQHVPGAQAPVAALDRDLSSPAVSDELRRGRELELARRSRCRVEGSSSLGGHADRCKALVPPRWRQRVRRADRGRDRAPETRAARQATRSRCSDFDGRGGRSVRACSRAADDCGTRIPGESFERHQRTPLDDAGTTADAGARALVDGLARDAERLGHLRPRPAAEHRAFDGRVFDAVGQAPERADGGERIGRVFGKRRRSGEHRLSTVVDTNWLVNPGCSCGP